MKLDCGPTRQERRVARRHKKLQRREQRSHWKRWFAWYPVRVASRDCRWLEFVERKDKNVYYSSYYGRWELCNYERLTKDWKYRPRRYE